MKSLTTLKISIFLLVSTVVAHVSAQVVTGPTIDNATQLCGITSSTQYLVRDSVAAPNGSPSSYAQPGPNYGCLGSSGSSSTLRPHWFRFEVGSPGTLHMAVVPTLSNNLDYVVFGPFSTPTPTPLDPAFQNPIACSNSLTLVDTIRLFNITFSNQYYFILITNPEGRSGSFSFVPTPIIHNIGLGSSLRFVTNNFQALVCDTPRVLQTNISPSLVSDFLISGPGIIPSTGLFNPAIAGVGSHIITVSGRPFGCPFVRTSTCTVNVTNILSSVNVVSFGNLIPGANNSVNVTATASPVGLYRYNWSVPSGALPVPPNSSSFSTNVPGWYKVTVNPDTVTRPACTSSSDSVYVFTGPTVSLNGPNTICNDDPSNITAIAPSLPTGVSVTSCQWQYRLGLGSWGNIPGQTSCSALGVINISGNLEIRLLMTLSNTAVLTSNSVQINALSAIQAPILSINSSTGTSVNSTICYNNSVNLQITTAAGGGNQFAYRWFKRLLAGGPEEEIFPRSLQLNRTFVDLTASTVYRVQAIDTSSYQCGNVFSNSCTVVVQGAIQAGSIKLSNTEDTLACLGRTITLQSDVNPTGANPGSAYVYYWEESDNGSSWSTIATTTNVSLTLTRTASTPQRKFYRRCVNATLSGVTCPSGNVCSPIISVNWIDDRAHLSSSSTYSFTGPLSHSIWETSSLNSVYSLRSQTVSGLVDSLRISPGSSGFGEYRLLSNNIPSDGILVFDFVPGPAANVSNVSNLSRSLIIGTGTVTLSNNGTYAIKVLANQGVVIRKSFTVLQGASAASWIVDSIKNFRFYPNKALSSDSICANQSHTITSSYVSTNSSPANWQWSVVNGGGTLTGSVTGSTPLAGPVTYNSVSSDAGTSVRLRLVATRSSGPCLGRSDTSFYNIIVRPNLLRASIASSQNRVRCNFNPADTLRANPASGGSGPYTYSWQYRESGSTNWVTILNSNSLVFRDVRYLTTTTFYRIVTTDIGTPSCAFNLPSQDSIIVTVLAPNQAPNWRPDSTAYLNVCPLSSLPLAIDSAKGSTGRFTYTWQYVDCNSLPAGPVSTDPGSIAAWPWISIIGKINQSAPSGLSYSTPPLPSGSCRYYRVVASDSLCGAFWNRALRVSVLDTVKPIVRSKRTLRIFSNATGIANFNSAFSDTLNNGSTDNCIGPVSNFILRKVNTGAGQLDPPGVSCPLSPNAPSHGNTPDAPIIAVLTNAGSSFNLSNAINYTSNYLGPNNQPSPDIFIRFNSGAFDSVAISSCGDTVFNSYLHLLDACGSHIQSNDDNGPLCSGASASLVRKLAPNTDYVVVYEGNGSSTTFGGNLTIRGINYNPSFSCKNKADTVAVLFARDASGNVGSDTLRVVVVDTIKPIVITKSVTAFLDSFGLVTPNAILANNGSTDNCDTTFLFQLSPSIYRCVNLGLNSSSLRVTDGSGNIGAAPVSVLVRDTIRPKAVPRNLVPVYLNNLGQACFSNAVIDSASWDNCKIDSSYAIVPNRTSTCFSCAQRDSVFLANYFVLDSARNLSNSAPFFAVIRDTLAPIVTSYPNSTVYVSAGDCQVNYCWENGLAYSDNCGTVVLSNPRINGASVSGNLCPLLSKGSYTLAFRLTDSKGNFKDFTHTFEVKDTIRPIITGCPSNITKRAGSNCNVAVTWPSPNFSDNCNVFASTSSHNSGDLFPRGVTTVKYLIVDGSGNRDSCSFSVTVIDSTAPVVNCSNLTAYLGQNGTVCVPLGSILPGSDNCTPIRYTSGISNSERCFNRLDLSLARPALTPAVPVSITACDSFNNCTSITCSVTVIDTVKPIARTRSNIILYLPCTPQSSIVLSASQVDSGSLDNDTIVSRTVSPSSFTCSALGSQIVTFTVIDRYGNQRQSTTLVTVIDTCPPSCTPVPTVVDLNTQGTASVSASSLLNCIDNCGGNVSYSPQVVSFSCSDIPSGTNSNSVTRTITTTDPNGRQKSYNVSITVRDLVKPNVTGLPRNVYLNAAGSGSVSVSSLVTVSDNCCIGQISSVPASPNNIKNFDCSDVGVKVVRVIASDCHTNVSDTVDVTVTVLDTVKPIVTVGTRPTIYLGANCSATVSTSQEMNLTPNDSCGISTWSPPSVSFNGGQCNQVVSVPVTVTDANGNMVQVTRDVMVMDTIRPVFTSVPRDTSLCRNNSRFVYPEPTASDNCAVLSITRVSGPASGAIFPVGNSSICYRVADLCGNSRDYCFNVFVRSSVTLPCVPPANREICTNDAPINLAANCPLQFSGPGVSTNVFTPGVAGIYPITWSFIDQFGCDSSGQFNISVKQAPVNPQISLSALNRLETVIPWSAYQWFRNGVVIPGEVSRIHYAIESGLYSCEVRTQDGCFDRTNSIVMGSVTNGNGSNLSRTIVYPNPSSGEFKVFMQEYSDPTVGVIVTDVTGRVVYRNSIKSISGGNVIEFDLDLLSLSQGKYLLTLEGLSTKATHQIQIID